MDRAVAEAIADVQVEADLRGMHSHGLRAIPMYLDRIRLGIINSKPRLRIESMSPLSAIAHGDDGPGQYVARRAMAECIERAERIGMAIVTARRSNHLGAVGYYANMAVARGLIGFATTNGNVMLPPAGSRTPVVGNNPMAWAFPAGDEPPLCYDVATSVVAGGKIDLAAAEGDDIPPGWGVTATGSATKDAAVAAASGMAIPLGAPTAPHKGFGLALVLEALAGVLSGSKFGRQHAVEVESGEWPWDEGHLFVAIDPGVLMPRDEYSARMVAFLHDVRSAGVNGTARLPGAEAHARREKALRDGLWLPSSIYRRLGETAVAAGFPALAPLPLRDQVA